MLYNILIIVSEKWYYFTGKLLIVPVLSPNMSALLEDELNLTILENICEGVGIDVNISNLAKALRKHRDTIREQVKALFEYKIINRPVYPFIHLYQEYPLLVIVRADLPKTDDVVKFLIENEHIFGAFYAKDEEYNTLLIMFFKDISTYVDWRKKIVAEKAIPPRDERFPASSSFFRSSADRAATISSSRAPTSVFPIDSPIAAIRPPAGSASISSSGLTPARSRVRESNAVRTVFPTPPFPHIAMTGLSSN